MTRALGRAPRLRRYRLIVLAALAVQLVLMMPSAASAATATVYVRGTVTCPTGQAFAGVWVASSAGKSGWAYKQVLPGTSGRMAKFSRTLSSVAVPTTVSINVGCGIKSGGGWRYVFNGLGRVQATRSGTVFINVGCSTSRCGAAPRGTAGPASPNPAFNANEPSTQYGREWCTYRASDFWKQMTGTYPAWGYPYYGDAGYWDSGALTVGWAVRSWPEPDSLMISQPSSTNSAGHVGYVADVRVSDDGRRTQVKIYDRNANAQPTDGQIFDRNGAWLSIPGGARFIRVPPRFTPYNR